MNITVKLYEQDSYLKNFTAEVQKCIPDGDFFKIVLNKTAFFPEGGGQYADHGTLNNANVLDVQIDKNGTIFHKTDKALKEKTIVTGTLDWNRRFRHMQNHSGEHIISGIIHSLYGLDNIGFHLGEDYVTCDYSEMLTTEQVKKVEALSNKAVFENVGIKAWYPKPSELDAIPYRAKLDLKENVRIVEIDGYDICACCAPHVGRTGEIGLIKITWTEKSHGGIRLHIACGNDALKDYNEKQENILKIMDYLSARQFETAEAVELLQKQNSNLTYELSQERKRTAEAKIQGLPEKDGNLVVYIENAEADTLRTIVNGGREKCTGVCVALTNSNKGYRYVISSKTVSVMKQAKIYNEALNGRGGGRDPMIQGTFGATLEEIKDYFEN